MTSSGLRYPRDLGAWRRWHEARHPLRRLRAAVRPSPPRPLWLAMRGEAPRLLVAIDAPTPTQIAALARPLEALGPVDAAVLAPNRLDGLLSGGWQWTALAAGPEAAVPDRLGAVRAILSAGHHLPAGALADRWGADLGAERLVAQHGLLTPYAPPIPHGATLFAFSDADAEFVTNGRDDVVAVCTGSQLLWAAGSARARAADAQGRPVYLGQLHGAELPRWGAARAAREFCRSTGAVYRPHPAEADLLSRIQHRAWELSGLEIDRGGAPMSRVDRPVVSAFSTGVLEAAACGLPAWVFYPNPPRWLREFWERYGMAPWGGEPTRPPFRDELEPAALIAEHISRRLGCEVRPHAWRRAQEGTP
ncbi:RNA-binding protein [Sinomonas sp. ASV322]|uniref:RNA-binding protein n=1 Tax=Sinomonas sp. ASV322 TaxID=3041920 RepID=UPI0027DC8174|nr:RNA-binding protein [Sinomonas sp. ASV322]MDQ4501903.1 RNA-binding protein [Sinomonas sp. ASV322]